MLVYGKSTAFPLTLGSVIALLQVLQQTDAPIKDFFCKGLPSLCLRCLASQDGGLREQAYKALDLFKQRVAGAAGLR